MKPLSRPFSRHAAAWAVAALLLLAVAGVSHAQSIYT